MRVVFGTAESGSVSYRAATADAVPAEINTRDGLSTTLEHAATVALQTQSFSGPMPPPDYLAQYDRIVPGAARLIVDEFRFNAQHAREVETLGIRGVIRKDRRAQVIAGCLVLIGFGLIYELAEHDHDGVAIAVAVTLLVSVLTAFLTDTVAARKRGERADAGANP
jgi:uncharacterized membrane protein